MKTLFYFLSVLPAAAAGITSSPDVYFRGSALGSIVGRGVANTNASTATNGVIAGGGTNRNELPWSFIGGGFRNSILNSGSNIGSNDVCVIAGGDNNKIQNGNTKHGTISGGQSNVINGARYATIGGGWLNFITGTSNQTIAGGYLNTNEGWNGFIGGGYANVITNAGIIGNANVIGGGGTNVIAGSYCFIGGGLMNFIKVPNSYVEGSTLCGGLQNRIYGGYSFLGGGVTCLSDDTGSSVLVGGNANRLNGGISFLGGGYLNTNSSTYSFLGAGTLNNITINGDYSSILGGQGNKVDAANAHIVGGGDGSTYSGITNATANSVELGTANGTKSRQDQSGFTTLGSLTVAVTNKTTTYTATAADHIVLCSASGGAFTVTLPAASARKGQLLCIKKTDSSANAVTVSRAGSDTIQGATTITLGIQYTNWVMFSDGSATWYKYGGSGPAN